MARCPVPKRVLQSDPVRRLRREQGTAMIEFVLATGLLILPMFFGVITVGLSLVLANQVTEVCRDTGHMYAYLVDFSQDSSKTLVTSQLAQGLGMTNTGGNGVIYLSTITLVDASSCTASSLQANSSSCPNMNKFVVTKRIVIGDPTTKNSTYAPNITPAIITSTGQISSRDYLTDPSVEAVGFGNVIALTVGQNAYLSEMFVNPPTGGLWLLFKSNIVAARSVF